MLRITRVSLTSPAFRQVSRWRAASKWPMQAACSHCLRTISLVASRSKKLDESRLFQSSLKPVYTRTIRHASSTPDGDLAKTPLYDFHIKHGAKMVPFGGFSMPVQYSDQGIGESHRWTREKASLFDVSHMVQYELIGPGASKFLSRITPSSVDALNRHQSTLSCFLHRDTGGIIDDTVITRLGPERFYFVTNAAVRDKDLQYLQSELQNWTERDSQPPAELIQLSDHGLIALQGPLSARILTSVLADHLSIDFDSFYFGQSIFANLLLPTGEASNPILVSRGGYTGEDGFELSIPTAELTRQVAEALLIAAGPDSLKLAGLGARDSLRLEAGMCLYGHDLDDTITPVEAGLSWIIGKDRRDPNTNTEPFNGQEVILRQLKPKKEGGGVDWRRVGLVVPSSPAREGAQIVDLDGNEIGKVTSGCPSPTLGQNIAMGYVKTGMHKAGTELGVIIRGKTRSAVVTKMPFIKTKFYKPPAAGN